MDEFKLSTSFIDEIKEVDTNEILKEIGYTLQSKYDDLIFKGGFILVNSTLRNSEFSRKTTDIDIDIYELTTWEKIIDTLEKELNNNTKLNLHYKIEKIRGFTKNSNGDSIVLRVCDNGGANDLRVKIDMNLTKIKCDLKQHMIDNFKLMGYSEELMLADKISVILSPKIFRRIKDLYDLYVLTEVRDYQYSNLMKQMSSRWTETKPQLDRTFIFEVEKLNHAYNKFEGIANKPSFPIIYDRAIDFIIPITREVRVDMLWHEGRWTDCKI